MRPWFVLLALVWQPAGIVASSVIRGLGLRAADSRRM